MVNSTMIQSGEGREMTTMSVCLAVAEKEGIDPVDLREPLYNTVDPNALNILGENPSCGITFEYIGYEITVKKNGDVIID